MYLTVHAVLQVPDGAADITWVDDVLSTLDGDKASLGAIVARTDGEPRAHAGVLWAHRGDAERASSTTTAPSTATGRGSGPAVRPGRLYEIVNSERVAQPATPHYVQLTEFTGPRSPEWVASHLRAGRERIWPAVRTVPGAVGALTGVADDGSAVTLALAESRESLGQAVRAILSTELLPGERPELLTGPDRIEIQRIVHVELPDDGWGSR